LINYFTVTPLVSLRLTNADVADKLLTLIKTMRFKGSKVSKRCVYWSQMIIYRTRKTILVVNG
jgi:hypothetical protein